MKNVSDFVVVLLAAAIFLWVLFRWWWLWVRDSHLRPVLTAALNHLSNDLSMNQREIALARIGITYNPELTKYWQERIWQYQGRLWILDKVLRDYWRARFEAFEQTIANRTPK